MILAARKTGLPASVCKTFRGLRLSVISVGLLSSLFVACSPTPTLPPASDTVESVFGASSNLNVADGRARFREIFCAVNQDHGADFPDYRDCNDLLARLEPESAPPGRLVDINVNRVPLKIFVVMGMGANCVAPLLGVESTVISHARALGQEVTMVPVEGLASTELNASIIRDTVMAATTGDDNEHVVLIGYSKGTSDILTTLVTYPVLAARVSVVVSVAGTVGGSALADEATQSQANLLAKFPGSGCDISDEGALNALKPAVRKEWLRNNPLPTVIRYYSIIAFPDPEHISAILVGSYKTLGEIDFRNDSQVIYRNQIIPGSTVLAFLNADHWAIAVPIARSHAIAGSTLLNHNAFPREMMLEALILQLQEDLEDRL